MAAHTSLATLIRPVFQTLLLEVHGLLQRSADLPGDQQPEDNAPLLPQSPSPPLPTSTTESMRMQVKNEPNIVVENDDDKTSADVTPHQYTLTPTQKEPKHKTT